jgi:hypothetical protein
MDFLILAAKEKGKASAVVGSIWPETAHDRRNAPAHVSVLPVIHQGPW